MYKICTLTIHVHECSPQRMHPQMNEKYELDKYMHLSLKDFTGLNHFSKASTSFVNSYTKTAMYHVHVCELLQN